MGFSYRLFFVYRGEADMIEENKVLSKEQRFEEGRGFIIGETVIAEFEPTVTERYHYKNMNSNEEYDVYIVVTKDIYGNTASGRVSDFLKIDWYRDFGIIDIELSRKGKRILAAKLQKEACNLAEEYCHEEIVASPGFYINEGVPIMVMGNRAMLPTEEKEKLTVVSSSTSLMKTIDIIDLKERISIYINFMPKVTVVLFYAALLGAIKPLLNHLSVITDFIIGVVAPSGHLKTSLTRLYTKWLVDEDELEISFDDSIRSDVLQKRIRQEAGQNFLIDDLHKKSNTYDQNKYKERLDKAVRIMSKVGNSALVFVTAESLKGTTIFSGHDRILQIKIPRMNSEDLEAYKMKMSNISHPYMAEIAICFVQALLDNYQDVKVTVEQYIGNKIFYNKSKFEMPEWCKGSTRIGNQVRVLYLVEDLFCQYMCENDSKLSGRIQLHEPLEETGKIQVKQLEQLRFREEEEDILLVLHQIIEEGTNCKDIHIVMTESQYSSGDKNMALLKDGCFNIKGDVLISVLMKRVGRPVSLKKVSDQLHKEGILDEDSDKRTKKVASRRHYVINIAMLENYCKFLEVGEV